MKGKAQAPKGKPPVSVLDRCRVLHLTGETDAEQELLAVVYRTLFGLNQPGDRYVAVIDAARPDQLGRCRSVTRLTLKETT